MIQVKSTNAAIAKRISKHGFRLPFICDRTQVSERNERTQLICIKRQDILRTLQSLGERPYVCETCGKAFKTVSAVNNHRAIHSEVKEFSCQYCPYSASTKANLKIHDRTHSGVQPYGCRYCPMKFSTASNMHKHIRNIHEKLKTHKVFGILHPFRRINPLPVLIVAHALSLSFLFHSV